MRRFLVESNATLAGVIFETSTRFRASMALFSEEKTLSHSFGRWNLAAMVETQGSCGKAVQHVGCEEEPEPPQRWASILSSRASYKQTNLVKIVVFTAVTFDRERLEVVRIPTDQGVHSVQRRRS